MVFTPRTGLAVIRHPLEEGGEQAPRILTDTARALRAVGVDVVEGPGLIEDAAGAVAAGRFFYERRVPSIVLAAATWSADPNLLDMLEECGVPVVTWAFPGMSTGSMCGCQQFGYVLKELGRSYRFAFGTPDEPDVVSRIRDYLAATSLAATLRKDRVGLVGYRVPGMTEVTFDEIELKAVLGPRTVHYGLEDVEKRMVQIPEPDALAVWKDRMGRVRNVSVARDDMVDSMRGYLTLKEFAQRDGLSGMAVECYPQFMGRLCVAGSLLADEGIAVGCEADMNSTVAMLILSRLTGGPVHNTDPLGVDLQEGSIVYSHCGNGSMSLADSPDKIEAGHVRLMHRGTCVLFPGKPGPVTLVNLVGRRGTYRMGVAYGQAVPTGMVFAGNPTKVVLAGGVRHHLDVIAQEGLGHHWMIGYGDARVPLQELCSLTGLRCIMA
jgi:L-fucose isomerase-like protein